jgi:hypothetical protein
VRLTSVRISHAQRPEAAPTALPDHFGPDHGVLGPDAGGPLLQRHQPGHARGEQHEPRSQADQGP